MSAKESNKSRQYEYDAFISYRHTEPDLTIAKKLHHLLENYRIPKSIQEETGIKKIRRVFRDQEELPTSGNLSDNIKRALESSRYLIVICSPRTPLSQYCCSEIEIFRKIHGNDKVLSILIEGEPAESFPQPLRFYKEQITNPDGTISEIEHDVEPLAADIRSSSAWERWKKLKVEKLRLLAPILGVRFDDLRRRHREQVIKTAIGMALLASIILAGFGGVTLSQANVITRQNEQLNKQNRELDKKNQEIKKNNADLEKINIKLKQEIQETLRQKNLAQKYGNEAVKQAKIAELQKELAESNEKLALAQRDQALRNQSMYLSNLSFQEVEKGDKIMGMLLALKALPQSLQYPEKPFVPEAESALYNSISRYKPFLNSICHIYEKGEGLTGITRIRHSKVGYAEFSGDGSKVLTQSDSAVKVWDSKTGLLLDSFKAQSHISSAVFMANSNQILIEESIFKRGFIFQEYRIIAHDLKTGKTLYDLDKIKDLVFSKEANRIITETTDGEIIIRSLENGQVIMQISPPNTWVKYNFSKDGTKLIIYSAGKAYFLKSDTCQILNSFETEEPMEECVLNSDGSLIGLRFKDTITVIDPANNKTLASYSGKYDSSDYFAFSNNNSKLIYASGQTVMLMSVNENQLRTIDLSSYTFYDAIKSSIDGKKLIIGDRDGQATIYDIQTGKELYRLKQSGNVYPRDYCGLELSPDNKFLLTYSMDKITKVWDIEDGDLIASFDKNSGPTIYASFDKHGEKILNVSFYDGTVEIWNIAKSDTQIFLPFYETQVCRMNFEPQGKAVKICSYYFQHIYDSETGEQLSETSLASEPLHIYVKSHDLKTTAKINGSQIILTGEKRFELNKHTDDIISAKFSPDDSMLVTTSWDKKAIIWNVKTGDPLYYLQGHPEEVKNAEFSPNGKYVLTISGAKVFIWRCKDGQLLMVLNKHNGRVNSAEYSPDSSLIVTASSDNTVRLWNAQSGEQLKVLDKHKDNVCSARFSMDNKRIISSSDDKTTRIWDVNSGNQLIILDNPEGPEGGLLNRTDAVFAPDGKKVVVSNGKTAVIYNIFSNTQEMVDYAHKYLMGRELTKEESDQYYVGE
ncbi:MAG: TIR domain-containing protein [Deltaproteobacteria bacterium]